MLLVCFCFFYGWIYVHNQPGLQALSPFPTLHLPPSRSDTSVTPSVSRRVHTWRQPIDFLRAHLWLQSSGRSTSGWRTTWGLFVWECFFFFLKRLPCWQNNCFVTQRWLLAVCICWTALSSQAPTAAGLWFSVFVWLLCHGNNRSKRPRNTCRCLIGFQPQQHQQ